MGKIKAAKALSTKEFRPGHPHHGNVNEVSMKSLELNTVRRISDRTWVAI